MRHSVEARTRRETKHARRKHRSRRLRAEKLENRQLLANSAANVFAQFQGELVRPTDDDRVEIQISSEQFNIRRGGAVTLGFVLQAAESSDLSPAAVDIERLNRGSDQEDRVPVILERTGLADGSSLVLAKLERGDYSVEIDGRQSTFGHWQLDVFLVGDVNGDFEVTSEDISLLKKAKMGRLSPEFPAVGDANRDGEITQFDVNVAKTNLAVSTTVRPLTVTAMLDGSSDSGLAGDSLVNQPDVLVIGLTQPGAQVRLDIDGDGYDDDVTRATVATGASNFQLDAHLLASENLLRVRARDSFGQIATTNFVVTLDELAPTVISTSPADDATVQPASGANLPVEIQFSERMIGAAALAALSVSGDQSGAISPVNLTFDDATNTLRFAIDATLPDDLITIVVAETATDIAGNGLAGGPFTFGFQVDRGQSLTEIASVSPAHGAEFVSLTRETVVTFSGPVDPTTIDVESLYLIAKGARVPAEIRVSPTNLFATVFYDNPLPESTEVRVVIDGDKIMSADGTPIDADGDGVQGGMGTADFRTLPLTLIPGTRVFGYVYDSYNKNPDGTDVPVVGATISLDARPDIQAMTDANGFFELGLQDLDGDTIPDGLPAPEFFVHIDGGTAINAPAGTAYATMGKPFHSVPGQRVQLSMPSGPFNIYLPPMAMGDIVSLPAGVAMDVGFGPSVTDPSRLAELFPDLTPEQRALLSLTNVTYPAGSAQNEDGTPATLATVIPVNPDRLPAPLPPTANPLLVISVQAGTTDAMGNPQFNLAGGSTNFAVPAPVTFPNLDGLLPGEKSLIWSFDHDAGKWIVVGTGTVSADGTVIVSDPGIGILAPGWHFTQVGTVTEGEPCVENQVCVQVNGGLLGDVIEVDLSGTGGREFQLHSNSSAGRIAEIDNWQQVLSDSGKFYFVPNFPDTEARFTPAPVTAEYTFSGIGRLESDPPDAPERRLFFTVQIKDIGPGYSTSGTNAVTQQSGTLNTYRVQQRLRYLGYQNQTGNNSMPVTVDGAMGPQTRHAIGVFNAAVTNADHVNEGATVIDTAINASNAPRWVELRFGAGITNNQVNPENWMTSWTRDALAAADALLGTVLQYTGASQKGGGDTPHHDTHEAGMDLDIRIRDEHRIPGTGAALTAGEQFVVDQMAAFYQVAGGNIDRILVGYQRIVDGFNTQTNSTLAQLDPGNVHDTHFHIDFDPPAVLFSLLAAGTDSSTDGAGGGVASGESTAPGFGTDPRMYYRFELGNGLVLSGRTTPAGGFSEVLTPNTVYTATFYQASTNRSAIYEGMTNASGQITQVGTIILDRFGGPDADGDDIPDIGETAIGTNPNNSDTDSDGISDDSELTQGLNPLDNSGFPTGVISSLPLPGNAEALAVANNLAYIATGSHGLAVVDGTAFDNPILLGQIDLPGTAVDVDVDAARQIAAVATGSSLELVDVSDSMVPTVRQSVALHAMRVEVVNGLAYAAADNFIRAIDLTTGTVVQTLILSVSGQVTAMAREGNMLYAFVGGSNTLLAIDVGLEGQAAVRGQLNVSITTADVGIFAGNDRVWLTGGGLRTVDVSNPIAPTLISGSDTLFSSRRIALNGSGLALVSPNGGNTLELYSTVDPQDTDSFLTRYNLTGPARDVAISRGIGYVAAGSRLEVVNYRPFDTLGVTPTVTVAAETADADAGTPGIQVVEGGQVFVSAAVTDDVQVRDVQWVLNGQVVDTDVSFPFDFAVSVPAIAVGGVTLNIQARITDTGGNSVLSEVQAFQIVPDLFAPTIDLQDPADGSSRFEGQRFVRVRFSEPINPAGVTAASFHLLSAGANGTPGDDDDVVVPADLQLRDNDRLVQLTVAAPGLAPGIYQLVIDQSAIADRAGNALGAGLRTSTFTIVEFDESADFLPFGTDVSVRQDDTSFSISPMPFTFEFFGQVVTGPVYVTTNGVIEFGQNSVGGTYNNTGLPFGNRLVAMPFWDDLDPRFGGTIGLYDADGVRVITYLDIPYYSDISRKVSFQIAFFSNGQIQIRYGRMDSIADGSATIGLSNGTQIAAPSLGNVVNDPTLAVTASNGLLSQAGLDALTADDQNDLLIFTPDGAGGYTITRNPGRSTSALTASYRFEARAFQMAPVLVELSDDVGSLDRPRRADVSPAREELLSGPNRERSPLAPMMDALRNGTRAIDLDRPFLFLGASETFDRALFADRSRQALLATVADSRVVVIDEPAFEHAIVDEVFSSDFESQDTMCDMFRCERFEDRLSLQRDN